MSAFVVQNRVINRIVSHLYAESYRDSWSQAGRNWFPNGAPSLEDCQALGQTIRDLNELAVKVRYDGDLVGEDAPYRFDLLLPSARNDAATLKALHCLLYQCSEGDVPQDPLFIRLKELAHALADKIATSLPEYQSAAWDG